MSYPPCENRAMNDDLITLGGGGWWRPERTTKRRLLNRELCEMREQGKRLDADGANLREFPPQSEQNIENLTTHAQPHIASFPSARFTGLCFLLFYSHISHISRLKIRAACVRRRFALFLIIPSGPIRVNSRNLLAKNLGVRVKAFGPFSAKVRVSPSKSDL